MVKAKSIRRSGRAGCQRLTQAPSSKHSLPVSVSRNPLDALGKGRNPTLQHLIIFQRVSWDQISSTSLNLKKTLIYLIADVFLKKVSICFAINCHILAGDTPASGQENQSTVLHQKTTSVWKCLLWTVHEEKKGWPAGFGLKKCLVSCSLRFKGIILLLWWCSS